MTDKRWKQLAEILVDYSTQIRAQEKVLITMMEIETFPLARAVYAEAIRARALPHIEFQSAYLERDLMIYGNTDQLEWIPELQAYGMEWADVYIGLRGARNPYEFADISSKNIVSHKKALGKVSSLRNDLTRWVLVRVPNESLAQQAMSSSDEIMDFFFNACIKNWEEETIYYQQLRDLFQEGETVRIIGEGTDLQFSTKGRTYSIASGHHNMPDGEIFTSPVDDSAQGTIFFEFPGIFSGQFIEGIQLEFEDGHVVNTQATKNNTLLDEIITMDSGSSRIGEFGIGLNNGIQRYCNDILYDEKIGGTIHIALGRAYKKCNGINDSSLHWDIVKDMRKNGQIFLDGKKVFQNGEFLF